MLEQVDLDLIFGTAHKRGFIDCEVYAETRFHTEVTVRGRLDQTRCLTTGGVAITLFDGWSTRCLSSSDVSTAAILALLTGERRVYSEANETRNLVPAPFADMKEKVALLTASVRAAWAEEEELGSPSARFDGIVRHFEVVDTKGNRSEGCEEEAACSSSFTTQIAGKPASFTHDFSLPSIDRFFDELRTRNRLAERVRRALRIRTPWPAPRGELPVVWSARATAKLCLQFLRAFEGDLVLRNLSFLNETSLPLELAFGLEERAPGGDGRCDHEGSRLRPGSIFRCGRPTALACDNRIAAELSVPTTGHCRRQSFETPSTIGFWSPRLVPSATEPSLLDGLARGLSVHDFDVIRFNPASGEIRLRLSDVFLVHHGEEGEAVAPIEITMELPDLLQRLERFSALEESQGFFIHKGQQRFLTEVTAPASLSRPIAIPGSVPLANYW